MSNKVLWCWQSGCGMTLASWQININPSLFLFILLYQPIYLHVAWCKNYQFNHNKSVNKWLNILNIKKNTLILHHPSEAKSTLLLVWTKSWFHFNRKSGTLES